MIYVMLGGPATGKGTRSKILSTELGIPHISTGELLRETCKDDERVKVLLEQGKLLDDDTMNRILFQRINQTDCSKGFILDGYPRKLDQVYALEAMMRKMGKEITKAIELVIPRELAFRRILERRQCPKCKKMYGIDFPSKKGELCDVCGEKLIIRSDDTAETLADRIDTYEKNERPITEYYKKKGILKIVDSACCPENILEMIK